MSGPLVRSSYRAGRLHAQAMARREGVAERSHEGNGPVTVGAEA
jgi:hypothetical protein